MRRIAAFLALALALAGRTAARNRVACEWATRHDPPPAPEALVPGVYCLETVALSWARTPDGCALIAYPVLGECEGGE